MGSRSKALSLAVLMGMSGCVTSAGTGGDVGAATVPLVHAPQTWDDAFFQMVDHCHGGTRPGPTITGDVIFTAGWVVLSLGIGALIISEKQVDDATVLAAGVGVVAGAGEIFTLVRGVQGRADAANQIDEQRRDWRAQWSVAPPPQRTLLLQAVAETCGEEAELADEVGRLGGLPAPPPSDPGAASPDGGAE